MTHPPNRTDSFHIIEDYLISDVNAEPFFHNLDEYFNDELKSSRFPPADIERAIKIYEIVLERFENRSKYNQNLMIEFGSKIYLRKEKFKSDPEKTAQLNRLIEPYANNPHLHKQVRHALGKISIFLTPAQQIHSLSADTLQKAEAICKYAFDFFSHLPFKLQQDFTCMRSIFNMEQPENVSADPHYKSLKALFAATPTPIPPAAASSSSSLLPQPIPKPEEVGSISSDEEEPAPKKKTGFFSRIKHLITKKVDEKSAKSQSIALHRLKGKRSSSNQPTIEQQLELQLEELYKFFHRVSIHYFSDLFFNQPHSLQLHKLFTQELSDLLPRVGRPLLVQEPRIISRMEKQVAINFLLAIDLFVLDFTKSCDAENSSAALHEIAKLRIGKKTNEPFGPDQLQLELVKQMNTIVEILVFNKVDPNQSLTEMQKLLRLGISIASVELINRCFQPDAFAFILKRLIYGRDWNASKLAVSSYSAHPSTLDLVFSKELGICIEKLADRFFCFGEADGVAHFVRQIALMIIQNQKENIGACIQARLNAVTSSECLVEPFRILDLILFEGEGTEKNPTLFDFLNKKTEERQQFRADLKKSMEEDLIPKWIEKLKADYRGVSTLYKFEASKSFCNTITKRLYMLIEDQEFLRILAYYLLDGAKLALKVEYKRVNEDRHNDKGPSSPTSYIHISST